ncbi:MAG: type I-G CRISPR-associated helicase/endonuclease Cas3g [Gemmataceae bacterium]
MLDFATTFQLLTGHPPQPWQTRLYEYVCEHKKFPETCRIPTGLGKTSIIAIWLIAWVNRIKVPRRLVYVVNRRTVVDQTTTEVEKYKAAKVPGIPDFAISTLRGQFADNRDWSADPSCPAIICGTVDMIGSRLLFGGYGLGKKSRPLHAGFLGQDVLLIHDEAHLEPAFQTLLTSIVAEQKRCDESQFGGFHVLELTATSRTGGDPAKSFQLETVDYEPEDEKAKFTRQGLNAKKDLTLHTSEQDSVAKEIAKLAWQKWGKSDKKILIYVTTVAEVKIVQDELQKELKNKNLDPAIDAERIAVLTGTMRGHERDVQFDPRQESGCPIFAGFMKPPKPDAPPEEQWKVTPKKGLVFLICTSAGEVGIDISADDLICDLTTLDCMAQRLGRVNRRGEKDATVIVVLSSKPTKENEKSALELARANTVPLLRTLPETNGVHDASPAALRDLMGKLSAEQIQAAFAPAPTILPATDILFDAWALTTITDKLPGRPPVEPYLHGLADEEYEPPTTQVAWRTEVSRITEELLKEYEPKELLEAYPLKPHELLKDQSQRVFKQLELIAKRAEKLPVWLVDKEGTVEVSSLVQIADKDRKDRINGKTILLPPEAGGLSGGLLNGSSETADDVADELFITNKEDKKLERQRKRLWNIAPENDNDVADLQLKKWIEFPLPANADDDAEADQWLWYAAGSQGEPAAKDPVLWDVHVADVEREAEEILKKLDLPEELATVVRIAAKYHDHGKRRTIFQRVLGNTRWPNVELAKSGKKRGSRIKEKYRHEFGSLHDLAKVIHELSLTPHQRDLVLHLIATHHGRGRPHFPNDEAEDPAHTPEENEQLAAEVPRRFARLQRKYGRWGLAYLESILRAADWAASKKPSAYLTKEEMQ